MEWKLFHKFSFGGTWPNYPKLAQQIYVVSLKNDFLWNLTFICLTCGMLIIYFALKQEFQIAHQLYTHKIVGSIRSNVQQKMSYFKSLI